MDTQDFDRLARRISRRVSRRSFVIALGPLIVLFDGRQPRTVAKRRQPYVGGSCKKKGRTCPPGSSCVGKSERGRCQCNSWLTLCGTPNTKAAGCFNLDTNPSHCGICERTCLAQANGSCQDGRCCTSEGGECGDGCGAGAVCAACCSGLCRLDGRCGQIGTCLPAGNACPAGCQPGEECPGCCDQLCDLGGSCSFNGCVLAGGVCTESFQCCGELQCGDSRCQLS